MATKNYLSKDGVIFLWSQIKAYLGNNYVAQVTGKNLSTNDYTTTEKNKLSGIQDGANKTIINNTLTSTSASEALSANQGKVLNDKIADILDDVGSMGGGDMMKATYDTNGSGVVDNAEKLGGQAPSYYAIASSIPTNNNQLTNGAGYQTETQVKTIVESVIGSAPDALNTLEELSKALGDDPNFATTITTELSKKQNSADLVAITNTEIDEIVV